MQIKLSDKGDHVHSGLDDLIGQLSLQFGSFTYGNTLSHRHVFITSYE
jgi:hypothetical protein